MGGTGDNQPLEGQASISTIAELRARRAGRRRKPDSTSPSDASQTVAAPSSPARNRAANRPGRSTLSNYAGHETPDADEILNDLDELANTLAPTAAASSSTVVYNAPAEPTIGIPQPTDDADEILAFLNTHHTVRERAGEPVAPRGSADLQSPGIHGRASRAAVAGTRRARVIRSQPQPKRRRGLWLLAVAIITVLVVGLITLSTRGKSATQPPTSRRAAVNHAPSASAVSIAAAAATINALLDRHPGRATSNLQHQISQDKANVEHAAELKHQAALKRRAALTKRKARTHARTRAGETTPVATNAPARSQAAAVTPAQSSDTSSPAPVSSSPAPSTSTSKSTSSSSSSVANTLGGIVGPACNPTCK
jgi:hypothetical protein